jgi:hypothetical protein
VRVSWPDTANAAVYAPSPSPREEARSPARFAATGREIDETVRINGNC